LQPLNVGIFGPLKRAYSKEIYSLIRNGVHHIDKIEFIEAYKQIRPQVLTEANIQSSFRATGLIPYNPERVISSLVITKILSPPGTGTGTDTQWTGETPHNLHQLEQQAQHLWDTIQRSSQSPTQALDQLVKGFQLALHSAIILQHENTKLKASNQRRTRKQQQRRQYIAHGGTLQAQQGQFLVQQRENRE
jgi:hypothetical protein